MKILVLSVLILFSFNCFSQEPKQGDLKSNSEGFLVIWSSASNNWLDIESFWIEYTNQNGGLTWGQSDQYPEYSKVKEKDTLMIETKDGICLMEFYHQHWRRANDVRRWNDEINGYAGCPYVFDD